MKRPGRPVQLTVTGDIDDGQQVVLITIRLRNGTRYQTGYMFPPSALDIIPHLAAGPCPGLRRAWRAMRAWHRTHLRNKSTATH